VKNPPPPRTSPGKPRSSGGLRAVLLAIGVHAAFFAVIFFGVNWQSAPPPPVEAQLWDKLPPVKAAAAKREPAPQPPEVEPPKPEPPKPEPPKPVAKPLPPPKPPPKPPEAKPEPAKPNPQIALKAERETKEREKRERLEREQRERLERDKLERKKEEDAKKKREQLELAKKKVEDDKRRKEEELAKAEADKTRAAAAAAKKSEFDRFVNDIRAKIRGRANVPDTVTGKPVVEVLIKILPGGEVLDITIKKRSGNPTYDTAIERGIRSASPLPVPPVSSELFPQFRELNLIIQHER
jgi:colicin import membrane protein